MDVRHQDKDLERLETDAKFDGGFGQAVVRGYRKVMQVIRAADNILDLYNMKSLRFEKLEGSKTEERSLRLNQQWRLIVRLDKSGEVTVVVIQEITDYH